MLLNKSDIGIASSVAGVYVTVNLLTQSFRVMTDILGITWNDCCTQAFREMTENSSHYAKWLEIRHCYYTVWQAMHNIQLRQSPLLGN